MAGMSNEDFLKMLEEDYPGVDFDNLPSLEEAPIVYYIMGMKTQTITYHNRVKPWTSTFSFVLEKEFPTIAEAEAYLEEWKNRPHTLDWTHEANNQTCHQTVDPATMQIKETKPEGLTWLHTYKDWKDKIAAGEKVFPMYLP